MTMRVLVIEDNPKHLEDAKAFFMNTEYVVNYVTNGEQAMQLLADKGGFHDEPQAPQFRFVVTDLYLPLNSQFPEEQPIGIGIAMLCKQQGVRCVICTAGHHHGKRYEWISNLHRSALSLPMVTSDSVVPERDGEAESKFWQDAVELAEGRSEKYRSFDWYGWEKPKS